VAIKLDQVNIVVRDMEAMAEFYNLLGIQIGTPPSDWAPHHRNSEAQAGSGLDLDSQRFAQVWNKGWTGGPGIVLGFRVASRDEVDRLFRELTDHGHAPQQAPYDAFWGSRYAVVSDPDGNAVGIMSPQDSGQRTVPPSPPFE
jgi:predicted lactoylglutathione lyase